MADDIFQKKEKQELMMQILAFSCIFIFLMLVSPPSFYFYRPAQVELEREDYSGIEYFLKEFEFGQFKEFNLISKFDGELGRRNPFLKNFEESLEEDLIDDDNEINDIEEEEEEIEEN